jgi:hypothetical protein
VALIGQENFTQFERMVLLQSIDTHWREHLASLDYLRQGIHLRGYAQKQPKQEYKREAFELFGQLLDSVKNEVTKPADDGAVQSGEQLEEAAEATGEPRPSASNITYTAPTETRRGRGACRRGKPAPRGRRRAGALSAEAACLRPRRPQRPVPLRQRQEVQAVPRQAELTSQLSKRNPMPVNLSAPDPAALFAVPGVRIGVAEAGVRKANRKDLTVVLIDEGSAVGGVFTQNRFCAAPVQVCRDHLAANYGIRAMVINTGNANAGTGEDGLMRTRSTCIALARHAGHRARADPAVLHRRDHGAAAGGAHRAGLPAALADAQPEPLGCAPPKAS